MIFWNLEAMPRNLVHFALTVDIGDDRSTDTGKSKQGKE